MERVSLEAWSGEVLAGSDGLWRGEAWPGTAWLGTAGQGKELIELMRIGETEHVAKFPGFSIEGNPNDYCLQGSSVSPPRQKTWRGKAR